MSAGLVELLGSTLVKGSETVPTADALKGKGAIALYFSAHWCPPCRGFTPKLAEWYKEGLSAKGLEIVFVSSDRDEGAFNEYFAEQPWMALPYADRDRKESLSKKFKVGGIPSVVIVDEDGKVITKDGRAAISGDTKGDDFPWKPKTLKDILSTCKLVGKEGPVATSVLDNQVYALYFSAHWCPPCRGFTPKLAEWYTKSLKARGLEVVFVSSDKEEDGFKEYYGEMPWLALDYGCRKEKEQLSTLFGVSGIPAVVLVDRDGSTITSDGRGALSSDPEGLEFPWYPKPVVDLAGGPGNLNDAVVVVAFCETADVAAAKAVEASMSALAEKYIAAAKAEGEDTPKICFMIAKSAGGIAGQLRPMLGMTVLPPAKHEHPMKEHDNAGGRWGCDGCNKGGHEKRFRCTEGCDHDYCEACYNRSGTGVAVAPKLMIVNIPADGAYHEGPEGDLTADVVAKFVSDFEAGSLERKQLEKN